VGLVFDVLSSSQRVESGRLNKILGLGLGANKTPRHANGVRVVLDDESRNLLAVGRLGSAGICHVPPLA
jgi:hypothetical protein